MIAMVQASDSKKNAVSRDGILLEVSYDVDSVSGDSSVICVLSNMSDKPLPFEISGANLGFYFKLLDSSGKQVVKNQAWEKMNGYAEVNKHSGQEIASGGSIRYALAIKEAFGERWQSGSRLEVEWTPGDDPEGNPLPTGRGIITSIETKHLPLKTGAAVSQNNTSSVPEATTPRSSLNSHPNDASANSMLWNIIVVLIVTSLGMLWLLHQWNRHRRRRSQ